MAKAKKHEVTEERDPTRANPSGAPEAGGATTHGSLFGGHTAEARLLRMLARMARAVEAGAYRRLRDLDRDAREPAGARGRPNRVRAAAGLSREARGEARGSA